MSGFGVPGSDAVWNPYQGSPGANAEASYSFGQYGDYAQLPQPLPNAPGGALNMQQAGIFRAFSGYGMQAARPDTGAMRLLMAGGGVALLTGVFTLGWKRYIEAIAGATILLWAARRPSSVATAGVSSPEASAQQMLDRARRVSAPYGSGGRPATIMEFDAFLRMGLLPRDAEFEMVIVMETSAEHPSGDVVTLLSLPAWYLVYWLAPAAGSASWWQDQLSTQEG
jgi:hypothetical protein